MPVNRQYTARQLAEMDFDQKNALPRGGLWVKFDDGTVTKTKTDKAIFCSHYWSFIVKHGGQLLQEFSMCRTIDGKYEEDEYGSSVHIDLLQRVFNHSYFSGEDDQDRFWEMSQDAYFVTNNVSNYTTLNHLRFMTTMSAKAIWQVMNHPVVKDSKAKFASGEISLDECHEKCFAAVRDDKKYFKDNFFHIAVRCGQLSIIQVKQIIGPRGNVPDINSEAFPHPIEAGFADRLNYAYDSVIEARSASVALYMQTGPLEDSEYNNRMCRMLCSVIRRVEYTDCGATEGLQWFIKDKAHLKAVIGKNIIVGDGTLHEIKAGDEYLIGKHVLLRAPHMCKIREKGVKCSKCIGGASRSIIPGGSPGQILIIDPLGQISQTILSTKHVLSNVIALIMGIKGDAAKYLHLHKENRFAVMLNKEVDVSMVKIKVPTEQAAFLSDIDYVEDIDKINVAALTDISDMIITELDEDENEIKNTVINTEVSGNGSCFTVELLKYIKEQGIRINKGYIEIDMGNWDIEQPVLTTKRVSRDVRETLEAFRMFIKPTQDKRRETKTILDCKTVDEAVHELWTLLSKKLKVSVAQVEMFVNSLMKRVDDYNLPDYDEEFEFTTITNALVNRSAIVSFGFEGQVKYLRSPLTYCKEEDDIPNQPIDAIFMKGFI